MTCWFTLLGVCLSKTCLRATTTQSGYQSGGSSVVSGLEIRYGIDDVWYTSKATARIFTPGSTRLFTNQSWATHKTNELFIDLGARSSDVECHGYSTSPE